MADSTPLQLHVKGYKRTFPDFVLKADFRVLPGEGVVLRGRSGSGKTTLLRWIAGFSEECDEGELFWGEESITSLSIEKRGFGVVTQGNTLFPHLNVFENAVFGLRVRKVAPSLVQEKAEKWLGELGLIDRMKAPVQELSGGEIQRLTLIRAAIWGPRLLLLDEPFSALDPELKRKLYELLERIQTWTGVGVLLITHQDEDRANLKLREIALQEEGRERLYCEAT